MPASNTGRESTNAIRRRPRVRPATPDQQDRTRAARRQPTPDQADRGRPPSARPAGVFAKPRPATAPLQAGRQQAQRRVDTARRRLPAPALAEPPIVRTRQGGGGDPLTPEQVKGFLLSQDQRAKAARTQIVGSIQKQLGATRGRERVEMADRLVREIATDPRLERTRRAIRHYTALEHESARPQTTDTVKAGPEPKRIGPAFASVNLTATGRAIAQATPGLQAGTAEAQFARNALKDVGTIATAPFVGAVGAAGVAKDVVTGHPGRAAETTTDFARGVVEGTIRDWSDPAEYLREHPLLFGLDVAGATAVVGRTAGAVARGAGTQASKGGVRGGLARAGSMVRPPLALSDDPAAPLVQRTYSKDSTRKAAQVAADATREPLRRPDGSVVTVTERGRTVPVLKARTRPTVRHPLGERAALLKGEADFAASRANMAERLVRDQASREMKVRGIKGRRPKDLVAMVVEGTITSARHFEDDLRAEGARIRGKLAEHARTGEVYRHEGELRAAQARVRLVDEVLSNPKVTAQREAIVKVGEDIGRKLNERERQAIALGLLHPARAHRARLIVPAVAHRGARYFREDELKALERSGVEVRDPTRVAQHRAAQQASKDAREREQVVQRELDALRHQRSRVVGAQAVTRGHDAQHGPLGAYYVGDRRFATREAADAHAKTNGSSVRKVSLTLGEAKRTGEIARLDRAIASRRRELTDVRRARQKADRTARRTPRPPIREALRGPDGRFLPISEIEDLLRSRGRDPDTVAYLPHRMDVRGARAFHAQFRPGNRGTMDGGETRTGAAYAKGVTESSANLIREQGVRQAVQISKAQALDRMVADMGTRRPDGAYFTAKEAAEVAQRIAEGGGERLVPIRAFAAKLDPETRRIIRENLQGPGMMESLGQRLLNDRIVREGVTGDKGARNVVLVPAEYVERLEKHLRPAGEITKFLQAVNRPFRFAVLAQPRWLTGQFVEPYVVRLTVNGSGLNVFGLGMDITAANRVLRQMDRSGDPKVRRAAQELRAQQLGGLAIGGRGLSVRRSADEFETGQLVQKLPVIGQGFDLLRLAGHALMAPGNLFFRVNRAIENVAQRAALGRDIRRDLQQFTGSWVQTMRLHRKALDEAAKGLVNTPTQRRFMKSQHEMLGKYEGYPPWLRTLIQGPLPFIPWMLNAARFTLWTMPAHHTALTALLTRVNDVIAKDWEQIHKRVPPGALKFAIPTKDGGWIDLARYTPYGLATPIVGSEGKNLESITDQFLPQASGALAAVAHGEDPFGRPLRLDPRENQGRTDPNLGQRVGIGAYGLAEALVPYLAQARRVREGGGTGYAGSTALDPDVKPGTKRMSGARRTFDPFRPTYVGGAATRERVAPRVSTSPSARSLEDELLDNLDRSLSDAQDRQRLEEELLNNLFGGG